MLKIITVVGARPQLIKAAAISREIRNNFQGQIEEVIVHTGQHYDANMSQIFINEMEIPAEKYNMGVGSGSHAEQTAAMMVALEKLVIAEKPHLMLLYGDTNSTLAGALVASKLHLKVAHVEGGVRSYYKFYPEEVNRLVCDHLSSAVFVPSDAGIESMRKEGFEVDKTEHTTADSDHPAVFRTGDIMYDNTLFYLEKIKNRGAEIAAKYNIPTENYLLVTCHRPHNVDDAIVLAGILSALIEIHEKHGIAAVLPLHPRTAHKINGDENLKQLGAHPGIFIIDPVSFLEIMILEYGAEIILTDSGGVQKEAYFMEKPCLIMLENTPWTELVESGNALIVGSDPKKIVAGFEQFQSSHKDLVYPKIYGDGRAANFICTQLIKLFAKT